MGLSKEEVFDACETIYAEYDNELKQVTTPRVLEHCGYGSLQTSCPWVREWKGIKKKENREIATAANEVKIPQDVKDEFDKSMIQIWTIGKRYFDSEIQAIRNKFEEDKEEIEAERDEAIAFADDQQAKVEEAEKKIDELSNNLNDSHKKNGELESKISTLTEDNYQYKKDMEVLSENYNNAQADIKVAQKEAEVISEQLVKTEKKYESANDEILILTTDKEKLESIKAHQAEVIEDLEVVKETDRKTILLFKDKNDKLDQELKEITGINDKLQISNTHKDERLAELKNVVESERKEKEFLINDNKSIRTENTGLQKKVIELESDTKSKDNEIKLLSDNLKQNVKAVEKKDQQIDKLNQDLRELLSNRQKAAKKDKKKKTDKA